MKPKASEATGPGSPPEEGPARGIRPMPDPDKTLDSIQLDALEQSFRKWITATPRRDVHRSRRRIFLIFLIIRYSGGKLSEVLGLDPTRDIDFEDRFVRLGRPPRQVQLSETLLAEIRGLIAESAAEDGPRQLLDVDPGFVRRKFYERAEACGIPKQLGAPEILRKSRAVEWMQNHMPLPVVQRLLGHSTPNLTSAYVAFSEAEIQQATRHFMEKESARSTSARNAFFGKIQMIQQGDIQSRVEILTLGGHRITTVITNDSLKRLELGPGRLITAEIKAPWVMLHQGDDPRGWSADNRIEGRVERITTGEINTECIVRISDGTAVCAVVTTESARRLALAKGDAVWVVFNSHSVVLLSD
ncbi:TOBE domain-containing protein [Desulfococcus multivorans]|nr:TOBE domain-containing protein [Desulfococcus multivorans]AOY60216.1 MOP modulated TOBE domain protein [Desulfococcus multivorans]